MTIHQTLLKYWGYNDFRPLQEEIINSALAGIDTLALLPTGGGKSICFQVPAMNREGICLVISPLIALMKDQVENLKKKNISAVSITSALSKREIDIALDNCIYGNVKFLYVSPERLGTTLFIERLKKMKVNLIAVDEAHCISQWGYDFRPAYLQIAEVREIIPDVPVLALTATATPNVVEDIQDKLEFKKKNLLKKSFKRKNLAYVCLFEEDKIKRALKVIENVGGTGVIYVRNRKKTKEIAELLQRKGLTADYYHAGLDHKTRDQKQNDWTVGKTQIIVSTNAFGMGIDVPHVRFVIHLDLPDSLEAYFQEAGRAGRDEKKAYAVILYNKSDELDIARRLDMSFPELSEIKRVYTALGNFFQVAVGGGKNETYEFDISEFTRRYNFSGIPLVYNSLQYLEKEGLISSTEAVYTPSKLHVISSNDTLYRFQVKHPPFDNLVKVILRSYAGLFEDYIKINEQEIANRASIRVEKAIEMIQKLEELELVHYLPQNNAPRITYLSERLDENHLNISKKNYEERKQNALEKSEAVLDYVLDENHCRSIKLLEYFGEDDSVRCGVCDFCLERNKIEVSKFEFESIQKEILNALSNDELSMEELIEKSSQVNTNKVIEVVQWMLEHNELNRNDNGLFYKKQ